MKLKTETEHEYEEYKRRNSDPYGTGVVKFAERWADLMEEQLSEGKSLADIAKVTSRSADTEGITGFMYGVAAQSLAYFWEYGEALRLWHNLETQIGDEGTKANESGGVLNPAIIEIKT